MFISLAIFLRVTLLEASARGSMALSRVTIALTVVPTKVVVGPGRRPAHRLRHGQNTSASHMAL